MLKNHHLGSNPSQADPIERKFVFVLAEGLSFSLGTPVSYTNPKTYWLKKSEKILTGALLNSPKTYWLKKVRESWLGHYLTPLWHNFHTQNSTFICIYNFFFSFINLQSNTNWVFICVYKLLTTLFLNLFLLCTK